MTLGELINNYRTAHNMSLQDFADKCDLSKAYISMLEKGTRPATGKTVSPSINTINSIAKVIGLSPSEIMIELDNNMDVVYVSKVKLTKEEERLIYLFRDLNEEGQEHALAVLNGLVAAGIYKKCDIAQMVEA